MACITLFDGFGCHGHACVAMPETSINMPAQAKTKLLQEHHMPHVLIEVNHALGQDEALRRLKEKLAEVESTHGDQVKDLRQQWDGNTLSASCKALGMSLGGTLTVEDSQVKIDAKVPLAAMVFKATIKQRVREEISVLLG